MKWDILNAILGHRYHQNQSNRAISSKWSQYLQQKLLWLQSVNGRVLSTRSFRRHQHPGSVHGYLETRSRSNVWKDHTHTEAAKDTNMVKLSVAKFGFTRFVWPCSDDSDMCDIKWRIKCSKNFRRLLGSAFTWNKTHPKLCPYCRSAMCSPDSEAIW